MSARQTNKIRAWLVERNIQVKDIALRAGVKHPVTSQTIFGTRNSPRVLNALLDMGVPKKYLALPSDFKRIPTKEPHHA